MNIVDTVIEMLNESEKGTATIAQIKKNLKHVKTDDIEAHIYSDLLNDGRFIFINGKWSLKESFTMKEIVKEHYKALGSTDSIMANDDTSSDETIELDLNSVPLETDETQEIDLTVIEEMDDVSTFVDFDEEEDNEA